MLPVPNKPYFMVSADVKHHERRRRCSAEWARFCWVYREHVGKMTDTRKDMTAAHVNDLETRAPDSVRIMIGDFNHCSKKKKNKNKKNKNKK